MEGVPTDSLAGRPSLDGFKADATQVVHLGCVDWSHQLHS